jgi:cbb3-type cytochrome oxidase subunit 3
MHALLLLIIGGYIYHIFTEQRKKEIAEEVQKQLTLIKEEEIELKRRALLTEAEKDHEDKTNLFNMLAGRKERFKITPTQH